VLEVSIFLLSTSFFLWNFENALLLFVLLLQSCDRSMYE